MKIGYSRISLNKILMKAIKIFVNFFELIQKERVRKYIQNNLKLNPPKDHKVPLWALDNLYLYPLYCGTYFL